MWYSVLAIYNLLYMDAKHRGYKQGREVDRALEAFEMWCWTLTKK